MKTLLLACALQQLEVAPFPAEVGDEVVLHARAPDREHPLGGLAIAVERPDGTRADVGSTDAAGDLRTRVDGPGHWSFRARVGDLELVAPLTVMAARRRWLYGLACVPLGLALAFHHVRALQRARRAADGAPPPKNA